jgi:hypothetical protein
MDSQTLKPNVQDLQNKDMISIFKFERPPFRNA